MSSIARIIFALVIGVSPASSYAATIFVSQQAPGPAHDGSSWQTAFTTIQAGLNAALPGDEVWVAGGGYQENLSVPRPGLSVYGGFQGTESTRPETPKSITYLTAALSTFLPALTIPASATGVLVDGFHITGSNTPAPGVLCQSMGTVVSRCQIQSFGAPGSAGGGVVCDPGSSVTLQGNKIESNTAQDGGGVLIRNATVTLVGNEISRNRAIAMTAGALDYRIEARGGGIADFGGTVVLRNNVVQSNDARNGGGLWAEGANVTLLNNTVWWNQAEKQTPDAANPTVTSSGGGIGLSNCQGTIRDNLIAYNHVYAEAPLSSAGIATALGGGLALFGGTVSVSNNTFANNVVAVTGAMDFANYSKASGGAVYTNGAPAISSNVFAYNSASAALGFGVPQNPSIDTYHSETVSANLFYRNSPETYGADPYFVGINGNIAGDPLFADGFHLAAGSPAIDRGDTAMVQPGDTDLDGMPRIMGARVDIGAYEFPQPAPPPRQYVAPTGSDANDGASWSKPRKTIQVAVQTVGLDGEVWVAEGTYAERIVVFNRVSVLGGFRGDETSRDQRDPRTHPTVLDGGRKMPVVTIPLNAAHVTLDGFTVRNGHSASVADGGGAGIRCQGQDVTISHNLIEDNAVQLTWDNPSEYGGGLLVDGGSVQILNNVFRRNSVSVVNTMGFPQFGNLAQALGGGAYVNGAAVTVANNLFYDNAVRTAGMPSQVEALGSGLYASGITGTIAGNTFARNSATPTGSARWSGPGGAVFIWASGTHPVLANNVIAFNSAGLGIGGGGVVPLDHNDVYGNLEGDVNSVPDPSGTNGHIEADPRFASVAAGNFHIEPDSPCVDAGDTTAAVGIEDSDGQSRVIGGSVDIGADEGDGTVYGLHVMVRVSPSGNDANDGRSWAKPKRTVQAAVDAVSPVGGQVWVAAGTYAENVRLASDVALLGGFAGNERDASSRDASKNTTILDGGGHGSVVVIAPDARITTVIDGFTIRNGAGTRQIAGQSAGRVMGGGIYAGRDPQSQTGVSIGGATISNNVIEGNTAFSDAGPAGSEFSAAGGGLYAEGHIRIVGNAVTGNQSVSGGGLYASGSLEIARNVIRDNTANNGAGAYVSAASTYSIGETGSTVAPTEIRSNLIARNTATTYGGGLYVGLGSPVIVNNTIVYNKAANGGGMELIGFYSNFDATLANNLVAFNDSGLRLDAGSGTWTVALSHNDVYGNGGKDYVNLSGGATDLHLDPLYLGPDSYLLSAGSPGIDAGVDSFLRPFERDLAGNSRRLGSHVDIGAYEFVPPGAFTIPDAARSLRVAAGLSAFTSTDGRLDRSFSGCIELVDAVLLVRKASGLDPNP